jgi:hypothetical protein
MGRNACVAAGDDVETLGDEDTGTRVGDGVSTVGGEEAGLMHRQPLTIPAQIASKPATRSDTQQWP